MGAVEQHRRHGKISLPVSLPVVETGIGFMRMINRRARQGLRLAPGVIAAKVAGGQATIEIQRITQTTLAQEVPEPVTLLGAHGAEATEFRVRAIIPGTRISCTPRSANSTRRSIP